MRFLLAAILSVSCLAASVLTLPTADRVEQLVKILLTYLMYLDLKLDLHM